MSNIKTSTSRILGSLRQNVVLSERGSGSADLLEFVTSSECIMSTELLYNMLASAVTNIILIQLYQKSFRVMFR